MIIHSVKTIKGGMDFVQLTNYINCLLLANRAKSSWKDRKGRLVN